MSEVVNKLSLIGDKCMTEMHLIQPGCTYTACGLFTKIKERIQKCMQTGNTKYIYKNDLVFSMIWSMINIKIWLKEENHIKF